MSSSTTMIHKTPPHALVSFQRMMFVEFKHSNASDPFGAENELHTRETPLEHLFHTEANRALQNLLTASIGCHPKLESGIRPSEMQLKRRSKILPRRPRRHAKDDRSVVRRLEVKTRTRCFPSWSRALATTISIRGRRSPSYTWVRRDVGEDETTGVPEGQLMEEHWYGALQQKRAKYIGTFSHGSDVYYAKNFIRCHDKKVRTLTHLYAKEHGEIVTR